MESFEPKKLLILRILEILTEYTNENNKLRQADIINLLKLNYDIECERKAVARNIDFLQQAGYEIVNDKDGVYLSERRFTYGELRLLIDSVLSNRHVSKRYTKDLVSKLAKEGGKFFKPSIKHIINLDAWAKEDCKIYFLNIELLAEAITNKNKISFTYNSYGIDKKLHPRSNNQSIVSPYQLLLKNGNYYLVCNYDKYDNVVFVRVDRMTDIDIINEPIKPITKIKGYENGLDLGKLSCKLPYMFEDTPQRIELVVKNDGSKIIDEFVEQFGADNFTLELDKNGEQKFSVLASPKAMRFWILQHGKYLKVLSPQSLVETIKEDISEMTKLYK